ncbi:bacterial 26-residue repeat-domain protein [Bombilactobacillus mellis]|uniref:Bacterial 26-residue repeat-domain protein n=1 Tax=Bombilactobacillus mellis TaxID=1218508 RepID=A0A0F4KP96_9LACO|nr:BspA family leucine-rich repeat surface protein [Bombilactobacillus mellis]KJY48472.1 bacterial 26-residue repeat-domain protein [Bombilactobacillus mellis]
MKKIIRLGLAFLIISFMVVSFQKFDCAAAVKTINVSKTEASGQDLLAVSHLQKKAPTFQLFSFLKDSPDIIASGTSGTCDWKITADGILTIDKGQLATGTVPYGINDPNDPFTHTGGSNWTENGNIKKIKEVDINPGVSLPKDATAVFANLPIVTEIKGLENLDTSETTNMSHLFDDCYDLISLDLSKFNNSQVTDMSYMFKDCKKLSSLNLNNFNTSQVTNMSGMFYDCYGFTSIDLSDFDTHNVTNMNSMFSGSYALTTLDLSNFNTSRVTDMGAMFSGCSGLKSLNVSKFDTSQVTNMSSMFSNCLALPSINVSNFNTGNVTNMRSMFNSCRTLPSINVNNFNTSKVTDMSSMFAVCSGLISLNLSNFDTSKVTRMYEMFKSCSQLQILDISSFDTRKAADYNHGGWMVNLFDYDTKLWQLKIGKNFEPYVSIGGAGTWPWPPTEFPQVFQDNGLNYITIGNNAQEFQWSEVGTGSPHNPKGKNFNTYVKSVSDSNGRYTVNLRGIKDLIANHDSDEPITLVWNNRPYNASPSLTFTDSSYRNPVISGNPYVYPYAYLPDDSRFCNPESYPALNIYGTLRDEDSSQVTLSYWIDDNSTNKKEVKTVDTTSSNGEKNKTKVNWSFAITDQDDLKALATPKHKGGGHTIHVEARDNGIDGQSQEVFEPVSATFEVPVAENAIVQFKYQNSSNKPLRDSQTLVRGATESNNNYSDGYVYDVKQYVPQYLWGKDKDNNLQRYSLSNYNDLISDNLDWGHIVTYNPSMGNLKSTGGTLREIPLTYVESGTISLEVPNLNFGSYIRQAMPSKCGLNYSVNKQPRLIVKDTTQSYKKYWKLDLSITKFINTKDPSKTLDGIFKYDNTPVDSGSEITIANGSNFRDLNITDCDISKDWYENNSGKQVKLSDYYRGPWLNLQGQRPALGTYQATATWTLKNTPQ